MLDDMLAAPSHTDAHAKKIADLEDISFTV